MAEKQFTGLLGEFDLKTEEQILAERARATLESTRKTLAGIGFRQPAEKTIAHIGSGLGALLGKKIVGDKGLSAEETRKAKILEHANAQYNLLKTESADFANLSPEEQQLEYQRVLAQSADTNGDPALAAEISINRAQKLAALQKQGLELDKLSNTVEKGTLDIGVLKEDRRRKLAGEYNTFVVPGPDGKYDLTNLEGNAMTGRVNDRGALEVKGPNGTITANSYLTMDEALKMQKNLIDASKDGNAGSMSPSDRMKMFGKFFSASQQAAQRGKVQALRQQMTIMDGIAKHFENFISKGRDPGEFLDGTGSIVNFVTNMRDMIKNTGNAFLVRTPDPNDPTKSVGAGPQDLVKSGMYEDIIEAIPTPSDMTGNAAAEYKSAIVELAYAAARANEPGARQLSDNDFRNALKEIGANAADPSKLRSVIMSNLTRKLEGFDMDLEMVDGIATTVGLNATTGRKLVFGNALPKFEEKRKSINERYKQLGTTIKEFEAAKAGQEQAARAGVRLPATPTAVPGAIDAGDGFSFEIVQ